MGVCISILSGGEGWERDGERAIPDGFLIVGSYSLKFSLLVMSFLSGLLDEFELIAATFFSLFPIIRGHLIEEHTLFLLSLPLNLIISFLLSDSSSSKRFGALEKNKAFLFYWAFTGRHMLGNIS